jgi:hypothetical protein
MRGDIRGVWIDCCARICGDGEAAHGPAVTDAKVQLAKNCGGLLQPLDASQQTVIAVEFD